MIKYKCPIKNGLLKLVQLLLNNVKQEKNFMKSILGLIILPVKMKVNWTEYVLTWLNTRNEYIYGNKRI